MTKIQAPIIVLMTTWGINENINSLYQMIGTSNMDIITIKNKGKDC